MSYVCHLWSAVTLLRSSFSVRAVQTGGIRQVTQPHHLLHAPVVRHLWKAHLLAVQTPVHLRHLRGGVGVQRQSPVRRGGGRMMECKHTDGGR